MAAVPYDENNTNRLDSRFLQWWEKLSFFLERFNLIPVAVVVSVYHYYQALALHDPFYVALPIAIFLDILHYRTVQQAARTRHLGWITTGIVTTAMVYTMQYIFYSQKPADIVTATQVQETWNTLVFAAIVPVGVAMMAVLHETGVIDAATKVQEVVTRLQQRVTDLQADNTRLQSQVTSLQGDNGRLQSQVAQLKQLETAVGVRDKEVQRLEGVVGKLNTRLRDVEHLNEELLVVSKMVDAANPVIYDVLQLLGGVDGLTQKAIAEKHGWSESKVSRLVGLMRVDK